MTRQGEVTVSKPPDSQETSPLLNVDDRIHVATYTENVAGGSAADGNVLRRNDEDGDNGQTYDNVPKGKRQIGLFSAAFLIFNRVIGTGIYATPSNILRSSGSVGVSLLMWLVGAIIAACGTAVYVELGTGLPRSGGEKNYLEYIYRRPKFMVTCIFAINALFMGHSASNGVVFSEYTLHSLSIEPTWFNTRLVAFICLTSISLIHGTLLKSGLFLQNTLGVFKLLVFVLISVSGILCLAGVSGIQVRDEYEKPNNFTWDTFWEGSGTGPSAFVNGLYNVIWSFIGYATVNAVLSEVRDPVKTIKRAAPLAVVSVAAVYLFINISYFAVVSKKDILESQRIVAALYFRNLFGPRTERALSSFIALSTLGNIFASQFSHGRVVQELGREGILPFSSVFASNRPFNAPLAGLLTQYFISCAYLFAAPPGDTYLFLINSSSYALSAINTFISFGLLLLYTSPYRIWGWNPPFRAPKVIVYIFFLSNLFLVTVPFFPPAPGTSSYEKLPYWSHSIGSFIVSLIGIAYWYIWGIWLPKTNGYRLQREWVIQKDGISRYVIRRVPKSAVALQ